MVKNFWYKTWCIYSGQLFKLTTEMGYDSRKFIQEMTETIVGDYYYGNDCWDAWLSPKFVLEDLQMNLKLETGETLPGYFMEWLGFLLRYWASRTGESLKEIFAIYSLDDFISSYEGLHVMDWDEIICWIKDVEGLD